MLNFLQSVEQLQHFAIAFKHCRCLYCLHSILREARNEVCHNEGGNTFVAVVGPNAYEEQIEHREMLGI